MTSSDQGGYSAEQLRGFHQRMRELRNAQPSIQLDLLHLSEQLTVQRARTFANEALGRRLPVVERTVLSIFEIYPPRRSKFLSREECTDVAINLHAFAINVYAVFDNVAWICMLQAGGNLAAKRVGLFRKDCESFLPPALLAYISRPMVRKWFDEYGKVYRDSTAHRIPPYLPDRNYTSEEAKRWKELNEESMAVLTGWKPGETHEQVDKRLARHHELQAEMQQLGRNSLMVALTLNGEDATHPVILHPQLLSDWGLVQELVQEFARAIRQQYGWKSPTIPPMVVA